MNSFPLVSVIMPIFNDYLYLDEAIKSILNQTYHNIEFIICNDGSNNPKTLEILGKYAHDDRIRILLNDINIGLPKSLNKCIFVSKGEYIARMDGDDVSRIDRLDVQMRYLMKNPNVGAVSSFADVINEEGEIVGKIKNPFKPTFQQVLEGTKFVHPASLFKKSALNSAGNYSESKNILLGRCEDYDLWCKLYQVGIICHNVPDSLLFYREISDSHKKRKRSTYKYNLTVKLKWRKLHKREKPSFYPILLTFFHWILPSKISYLFHKSRIKKNDK